MPLAILRAAVLAFVVTGLALAGQAQSSGPAIVYIQVVAGSHDSTSLTTFGSASQRALSNMTQNRLRAIWE